MGSSVALTSKPRAVRAPEPGCSTAEPLNVSYRLSRFQQYLSGRWLDLGCADGGYAEGLLSHGAGEVFGVEADPDRVAEATARNLPNTHFQVGHGEDLPFPEAYFDGTFMNEVFEHVADEMATLAQIHRVLRPSGVLVLISPNRWFPFEGHGMRTKFFKVGSPVPILPWLPAAVSERWMRARNYWPHQLLGKIRSAGFVVERCEYIWPVLESYPWLPAGLRARYQAHIGTFDHLPALRRLGVSTMAVARRPG